MAETAKEALIKNSPIGKEIKVGEKFFQFTIAPLSEFGYANLYGADITERVKYRKELEKKLH